MTRGNRENDTRGTFLPRQTGNQRRVNPGYIPPIGNLCPFEKLPPEVLAYIFELGTRAQEASEDRDGEDGDEECSDIADCGEENLTTYMPGAFALEEDDDPDDTEIKEAEADGEKTARVREELHLEATNVLTRNLPFQVRVSHVCHRWRQVALQMPTLWTTLEFNEPRPFRKSQEYLERSKHCPLDLLLDVSLDEASLSNLPDGPPARVRQSHETKSVIADILELVVPHISRWRTFELTVSEFSNMAVALNSLERGSARSGAPLLQALRLYCHEADGDPGFGVAAFNVHGGLRSPFGGNAPKLLQVELWGVHLDWNLFMPLSERKPVSLSAVPSTISNLTELELAYHTDDVRPPYETFVNIIRCSPKLTSLKLASSGPGPRLERPPAEPLYLPNLQHLSLGYFGEDYAIALLRLLYTPALTSIALDFDEGDYTDLVKELTEKMTLPRPLPGYFNITANSREALENQTRLSNVTYAKLGGLPCDAASAYTFYVACRKLEHLHLNMNFLPFNFFFALIGKDVSLRRQPQILHGANEDVTPAVTARKESPLCKQLAKLSVTGVRGGNMVKFVKERKSLGIPVHELEVDTNDNYTHEDLDWLSKNVLDSLNIVVFSDDEEEDIWVDEDELGLEWDGDVDMDDEEGSGDEVEGHTVHAGVAGEDYWESDEGEYEAEEDDDEDVFFE